MRDYEISLDGKVFKVEEAPTDTILDMLANGWIEDPDHPNDCLVTDADFRDRLEVEMIARRLEGRL
jgi:hypothetical protein